MTESLQMMLGVLTLGTVGALAAIALVKLSKRP